NIPRFTSNNPNKKPLPFKITTRQIVADDGEFVYQDHGSPWSARCPNMSIVVAKALGQYYGRVNFHDGTVKIQNYLPMTASMDAGFKWQDKHVLLRRIHLV